jgi:RNA polymerase sigma factor (sigma-70 family)
MEAATLSPPSSRGASWRLRRCADERLVERIRGGDERCFEVVYDRYHRQLLAFCRHMLGTREEAEDALQQVFISAHRQLLRDDRPIQLKPWLYAIARNRCLSTLRDRRATVGIDVVPEPSTDGLTVAGEVERRQDLKDILGDLATLPDDERAALVLAELGDLSHEEIAAALDVRKDRVKALIFQARQSLLGSREAREADCSVIQEQLATLRGGALRRSPLRRHVAICGACTAFEAEVGRQRAALALVLPVLPTLALKHGILASVLASGSGVAAGTGAGAAGLAGAGAGAGAGASAAGSGSVLSAVAGSGGLAVKVAAAVALSGAAVGGGVAVERSQRPARVPVERSQGTSAVVPSRPTPPGLLQVHTATPGSAAAVAKQRAARARGGVKGRPATPGAERAARRSSSAHQGRSKGGAARGGQGRGSHTPTAPRGATPSATGQTQVPALKRPSLRAISPRKGIQGVTTTTNPGHRPPAHRAKKKPILEGVAPGG